MGGRGPNDDTRNSGDRGNKDQSRQFITSSWYEKAVLVNPSSNFMNTLHFRAFTGDLGSEMK
ncbi:hypothetical protein Goari_019885, partial [Gossypium aridum]|nr:hypothetical protein [Gossypium aridum]